MSRLQKPTFNNELYTWKAKHPEQTTTRATCSRSAWSQRTSQTRRTSKGVGRTGLPTACGVKKVLAEIDQDCALESRAGKEERQGDGGAQQYLETTKGSRESEMVVMSVGRSTRHRHGGVLGHGGPTGQRPRRSHCIVDRDGSGILDPVTRQHTRGSHEALKEIVQDFANNLTTGEEAPQIGRVDAGATAPTEDSWVNMVLWRHVFATVLQRIRSRVRGLSQTATARQRQGQFRQGRGRIRMGQEQLWWEQGQQLRDVQGRWKGEQPELLGSHQGVREGWRKV